VAGGAREKEAKPICVLISARGKSGRNRLLIKMDIGKKTRATKEGKRAWSRTWKL